MNDENQELFTFIITVIYFERACNHRFYSRLVYVQLAYRFRKSLPSSKEQRFFVTSAGS